MAGASAPSPRGWATASLAAAVIWLGLSLAPTFITTLLGLPFAAFAFGAGWLSRRRGRQVNDPTSVGRANWALGVGCAGCVWQVIIITAALALGGALLWQGGHSLFEHLRGTPTP